MMQRTFQSGSTARRGFTLVEMLVVIGILLVLTALTMLVTGAAFRASEVRTTESAISLLETALSEWENTTGRQILYGVGVDEEPNPVLYPARYDIKQKHIEGGVPPGDRMDAHFDDTIFDLMDILERTDSAKSILANIDPELLQELTDEHDDTRLGVRDAWDNPIRVIFPGRNWGRVPGIRQDADETERTLLEDVHGVATDRRICFVSAGPDGKWGDLHLDVLDADLTDPQREDILDAADNIYSYEVLRTRIEP